MLYVGLGYVLGLVTMLLVIFILSGKRSGGTFYLVETEDENCPAIGIKLDESFTYNTKTIVLKKSR